MLEKLQKWFVRKRSPQLEQLRAWPTYVNTDIYIYKSKLKACRIIGENMPQSIRAFNSPASTGTNPCVNKGIYVMLMHGLGTLNSLNAFYDN